MEGGRRENKEKEKGLHGEWERGEKRKRRALGKGEEKGNGKCGGKDR